MTFAIFVGAVVGVIFFAVIGAYNPLVFLGCVAVGGMAGHLYNQPETR